MAWTTRHFGDVSAMNNLKEQKGQKQQNAAQRWKTGGLQQQPYQKRGPANNLESLNVGSPAVSCQLYSQLYFFFFRIFLVEIHLQFLNKQ